MLGLIIIPLLVAASVASCRSSPSASDPDRSAQTERAVPVSEVLEILEANARAYRMWAAPQRYHALEVVGSEVQRVGTTLRLTLTLTGWQQDERHGPLVQCVLDLPEEPTGDEVYVEFAEVRTDGVRAVVDSVGKLARADSPAGGGAGVRTTVHADVQLVPVRGGFGGHRRERADELLLTIVLTGDSPSSPLAVQVVAAARPAIPASDSCFFDPFRGPPVDVEGG